MERCYKYWNCKQTDCPVYGHTKLNCWDVEGTHCDHQTVDSVKYEEKYKCKYCIYYKSTMPIVSYYTQIQVSK